MLIKTYKKGSKSILSKTYSSLHFDCKCNSSACSITLIDSELPKVLEAIVAEIKQPLLFLESFQCFERAKEQRMLGNEFHTKGQAVKFIVNNYSNLAIGLLVKHLAPVNSIVNITKDYVELVVNQPKGSLNIL